MITNEPSHVKQTINTIAVGGKELKTTAIVPVSDAEIDYYLDYFAGLYPNNFRAWHARWIKQNSCEAWAKCARIAQQEGREPAKYLVWLLKREVRPSRK